MKFTKHTLKNGLRYIFIPLKQTESALVMTLVSTGSDYESATENGLSHFLEHMCFKGTEKRPLAKDIALEFDSIGADYNAFTGRHSTGYYARAHKKHLPKILEMVSDIYLHSTFPEEEMQKEKGVVIQEINMYNDDPQYRVSQLANERLYGNQPAGRDIAGTKETVGSFTRKNLVDYHTKNYSAKNTLVVVAGNFNEKATAKQLATLFEKMRPGKKTVCPKVQVTQKKPDIAVHFKETDQTHLILSFRMFGYFDKRMTTAKSMSYALGSGMSSRLFQKMREELGICYYISSGVGARPSAGTLSISAGVANDRVEEALRGIVSEVRKFRDEGITPAELEKVTECRLSGLVLHLETTEDFADFYGREEILKGKVITPKELAEKIEAVTVKDINKLAKETFKASTASLALVGPFKEADKARFLKIIESI